MSILDSVQVVLAADSTLMSLLIGGIFADVSEISRQNTSGAFDTNKEIKPCALIKANNEIPTGPYVNSMQLPLMVYFYERAGYANIEPAEQRVFALLNRQKVGAAVWELRVDNVIYRQWDDVLQCSMMMARYVVLRRKV